MRCHRPVLLSYALFVAALPAIASVTPSAPGLMANGTIGKRETVCANDLYVRTDPGTGAWMGTLFKGQTFLVERRSGGSVYGFAYGDINRRGWVTDGYFCP
ncbi:hypothetical protein POL68_40595 [Stigmatella sp. ncwal1]|uniref:SH3 domain-containing protein n=1 Tax=Stigmatella ashevillensis TaxID=2995309 RepID=A0ABT5DMK0_9BACT|nr:hypothetical protein [Stigmatella ashevillena]MDC0714818.1 hypothetical protein [Stigmatella ashevillena]